MKKTFFIFMTIGAITVVTLFNYMIAGNSESSGSRSYIGSGGGGYGGGVGGHK